jgi:ribonuclease P protein component
VRNLRASFPRSISLFSVRFFYCYETHIPAKSHKKKTRTWFSCAHVHPCRSHGPEAASSKGPSRIIPLGSFARARANETNISNASFKQRFRLTNAADFERVFRQNQRSVDDLFTVLYRRNGLGYPRLGLAIAKRQVRFAVERNRLKRLIRESFRGAKQQLSGLDIVIMARRKAGVADNAVVYASLARHWESLSSSADH